MYDPPAADSDPLHRSGEAETTPKEHRRQAETAPNSGALRPIRAGTEPRWTRVSSFASQAGEPSGGTRTTSADLNGPRAA